MPNKCTITAKVGAGAQATGAVINDFTALSFDFADKIMQVFKGSTFAGEADLTGVSTITISVSSGNYTVTVS